MLNQSHDTKNPVHDFRPHVTRDTETNRQIVLSYLPDVLFEMMSYPCIELGAITAVLQVPKQRRNGAGQEA